MHPEKIFHDDPEIRVTSTQIVVRGKSVSLGDALAVEEIVDEPRLLGLPVFALLAAIGGSLVEFYLRNSAYAFLFEFVALLSVLAMFATAPFYTIFVVKADGAVAVLRSHDQSLANCTRAAIEAAIAHRDSIGDSLRERLVPPVGAAEPSVVL